MSTTTVLRFLLTVVAAALIAPGVMAAPIVIVGSTYSLYLTSGNGRIIAVSEITFDGNEETFTRTVNLGGGQSQDVTFTVDELQFEVAGSPGTHRIGIDVRSDADLFPSPNRVLVGFAFGMFDDNPLDLQRPVRLDINRVSLQSGVATVAGGDWAEAQVQGRQTDPWDGYFLTDQHFGAFINDPNLSGRVINRLQFTMEVREAQGMPEPGALALAAAGLVLLGVRRRGR